MLFLIYLTLFKRLTPLELLIASIVLLTNFSISTGGYILIIYITLIPYLLKSKEYIKLLFFILLIYALPMDAIEFIKINNTNLHSYLGGNVIIDNPELFVSIGSILRPTFNFLILIIFSVHLYKKYPKIVNAR